MLKNLEICPAYAFRSLLLSFNKQHKNRGKQKITQNNSYTGFPSSCLLSPSRVKNPHSRKHKEIKALLPDMVQKTLAQILSHKNKYECNIYKNKTD